MARYLALKQETAYHGGGTPDIFLEVGEANFEASNEPIYVPTIQTRESQSMKLGEFTTDISFSGVIDTHTFGYILKFTCGTVATTGTGTFTHTFKPTQIATPLSFVAERGLEAITAERVAGGVIDSLEISLEAGGLAEFSVDGYAGKKTLVSPQTPTFGTLSPFAFWEGNVKIAGTSVATVRSITITQNENIAWDESWRIRATDGRFPAKVFRGEREITFETELVFENTEALGRFFNGVANATEPGTTYTPFSLELTLSTTENNAGTLTILMPKVVFEAADVDLSGLDILTQTVSGKALYHAGSAAAIIYTLINTKTSY